MTVVGFVKNKQPPERIPYVEMERAVRVIEVANLPLTVEASGFGSTTPAQTWSAISTVKGDVIFRHADLVRTRSLVASGAVPQARLDTQLRATLQ